MNYEIIDRGLRVTITDEEQQELKDLSEEEISFDSTMYDLFDELTSNGLMWVLPEDIGALTDAPMLSEASLDDDGTFPSGAVVYWYPNYQVRSPLHDLRDYGSVVFDNPVYY